MQSAMAVPPRATRPEEEQEADGDEEDEFTFPTPPPQLLVVGAATGARARDFLHLAPPPCAASASSSPPVWLLSSSSSPIRRSFSAADCAASPWHDRVLLARRRLNGGCSPALSDYAAGDAGFCEEGEEEEERMDSLWEDLNDDDAAARGEDLLFGRSLDVSRIRFVAAANAAEQWRTQNSKVGYAHSEDELELPELVRMDGAMEAVVDLGRGSERARPTAGDAPRRPRAGRQEQGRAAEQPRPSRRPVAPQRVAHGRRRSGGGVTPQLPGVCLGIPRHNSGSAHAAEGVRMVGKDKDHLGGGAGGAVLGASRSSRRRPPGLVAMMRSLRRMFVAHKGKSRVHRDEQSIASASAASAYSFSRKG